MSPDTNKHNVTASNLTSRPSEEKIQPWRAIWPLDEDVDCASTNQCGKNEISSPGVTAKYWYNMERGGYDDSAAVFATRRERLSNLIAKKFGDGKWYYPPKDEAPEGALGQNQFHPPENPPRCESCGETGGCTCSTLEGG